jgi:autotransporter-associated beta strand protein
MKTAIPTKAARLFLALTALALLLATGQSQAQETWIGGGGDDLLSNTSNWQGGIRPDVSDAAQLIYFDSATNLTPNNNYLTAAGELRFQSGAGAMTLSGNQVTVGRTSDNSTNALVSLSTATQKVEINIVLRGHASNVQGRNFYVAPDGTMIIDGLISSLSATPELIKVAGGTLILNGANTYSSGTRINAGSLFINNTTGSGTGSGVVFNSPLGTIGGSGSFSGNYSGGGTISPGATGSQVIGTLTAGGNVDWGPSSLSQRSWEFNLGTAAASLALAESGGSMQDQLVIGGNFTKNTSSGGDYQFDFLGGGQAGWYKLIDWAGTTGFSASDFDALNLDSGLTGSFTIDNDALYLEVIPEPATFMMLLGGLGAVALLRRRRASTNA